MPVICPIGTYGNKGLTGTALVAVSVDPVSKKRGNLGFSGARIAAKN
jgi:hypothetical protein